ncbi:MULTISPECIES: HAMP domain-containing sensor histidine kinase [unclassified Shewanella]|uniref:sensor histidine kinase n=2 Tax=unclassified Shewanella TaxID=196818 RepID=UPI000C85C9D3|nr:MULTISPECIES: HAMP domain-containing sensor histidine kinase [unclassified Shewanella]MDO6619636.1 HAMP domain-containing sensor histidine kinase [Shewanella sp. 6_MG-2023]MDO6640591.1 HAMP domain-containing sensor histidine kinase [Shewanella sp. 5_MG-2023]MDO6678724.1 HAMP domain-containing sensor histidine kinase [Shewanella sp. 4_MG-2023]PMG42645.1 two-component sensor histidine kinase [Shewanella sp. 10N.286.52.B9]PMH89016.1 two-component sensor histidine kinase [Shewanella sp. 10N.286
MTLLIVLLVSGLYRQLVMEQESQVEQHLATEMQRYKQLALTVDRRSFAAQIRAADPKTALIAWRNNVDMVGALSFVPDNMPLLPETRDFPILTGGPDKLHILTGGLVLTNYGPVLIATRTDNLAALIDKFVNAAFWMVALTLAMTLAVGFIFSKAILRRLVQYNLLSQKIEQGQYDTRFPVSHNQDEFDMLAGQFNRVLDTLEHNLMSVRGVTDNIAHDLRTPLSHLRIGIEQLPQKPAEQVPELTAMLLEELDHCLATFDAMLSLTRIEEGQQTLDMQPVSLQQLCQDLYEMAEVVAESKQQTLNLVIENDVTISGDKYLLFQALFNLVDNAIKYAPEDAEISIVQQGRRIQIIDNGPGINAQDKERVFERLVRLDPSRHHQGTGLGLSMVKAILSRHRASIELVDNNPGLIADIHF